MNRTFTSKLALALGLMAIGGLQPASAFDMQVAGIYYNKLPDHTCEVTYGQNTGCYSGTVTVPETIIDYAPAEPVTYTVIGIGENAFAHCDNLFNITLPSNLLYIGASAFVDCYKLKNLIIPESVTEIDHDAFRNCKALTSLEIPSSITYLPDFMCYSCEALTSVHIPESVTEIRESVFYNCAAMTEFTIPESVKSIGRYAFSFCGALENINIPEGVTAIRDYAYMWCKQLREINIPEGITEIGQYAFYKDESLESINIPGVVTHIGEMAFADCDGIKEIRFGDGTEPISFDAGSMSGVQPETGYIGRNTGINFFAGNHRLTSLEIAGEFSVIPDSYLKDCDNLATLILGEKVEKIEAAAFEGCSSIRSVSSYATIPPVMESAFSSETYSDGTLSVPDEAIEAYKGADEWKNFKHIEKLDIPNGIDSTESENNGSEIFTISGLRVSDITRPGLYIVRDGKNTRKIQVIK